MHGAVIAGRYEIRDRIGEGAHALVVEAYDRRLSKLVAIKILPRRPTVDDAELLLRFEQEARTVARLSHPGIVPVHDFGRGPDYSWLAMDLVIGGSLEDCLRHTPRLSVAEAARIVIGLLEALAAAHWRGIVHRDIKPANILLAEEHGEELGRVRVTDFGVAHMPNRELGSELTLVGQILGTPSTMSPEQIQSAPPDPRMDLWASGVVLYRALTGQRPFEGANFYATINAIQNLEPPQPSMLVPGLLPAMDAVVDRALQKKPEDRFQTAEEMAAAVRSAAAASRP